MSTFDLPSNRIESSSNRAIDNAQLYNQTIGLPSQSESQFGRYPSNESASNQLVKQGLLPDLQMRQDDSANMNPQATASFCGDGGRSIRNGEIIGDDGPPVSRFDGLDDGIDEGRDGPDYRQYDHMPPSEFEQHPPYRW